MSVSAPDDAFLDVNDAHLRVYGNVHADGLKLGQLEVVTTTSTGSTINFLHQHTAFTTTSNIDVGTTNHELFVDTNLSRVGVLTNTPTTALDVNGTVTATAFAGDGANLTGIPSSAINGTLSQWTTVTGPKIHYSDGNVGVGVADPAFKLDVDGDINFTGTLREDGNPFVSTPWTIESGPTALSYTGGNVGIGAGTPSAKLEVTGNAHVSTDLSVGGTLSINTITAAATHALSAVTAVGASTGDTIQLTHATTGLVTTANVEVGKDLTVAGGVTVDTNTLHVDSTNNRVGVGTTSASGTLDVSSTRTGLSGLATNEATLMISCTDPNAADEGDIGGGVVFRQRWNNPSASLVPTGGIYGYKDRNSGSYGGGLLFTYCPNDGTGGALSEAMRITKEGNVVIGTTQIRGDGDIKFSTQAYTGIRHVTASTNASSYVAINVGKLYRGDNSGVAAFVTYSPVYISSSNANNNALNAVGMFKFTQVKVRGTGTQMRAVTDFYSYDSSTVSLSINGNQETIIAISNALYANRSYMAVVHFVNTGIHGL